jgi:hypothetical protein
MASNGELAPGSRIAYVEFVGERGHTIRTHVYVTWDNRSRDVSMVILDAAANVQCPRGQGSSCAASPC